MKKDAGFIKAVIVFAVAACVILAVFLVFAQNFTPGVFTTGVGSSISAPSSYQAASNPLLDFGPSGNGNYGSYGGTGRSVPNTDGIGRSPYAGQVYLSSGTASYAVQTFEEYITLHNSGAPVDITGWTVTNSKGTRPTENVQNSYFYPTADSATIGFGTEFLDPTGAFKIGDIVLQKGDEAILVTGRPFSGYPFSINTSFRENICMGYLKVYPFNPPLNDNCPAIANDPLVKTVTDQCYDYIRSLATCEDPEKEDKTNFENNPNISSLCQQFVRPRANYAGCVGQYRNNSNFSLGTWRIFLGKDRELWASSRETITLYDRNNLIVDQISY